MASILNDLFPEAYTLTEADLRGNEYDPPELRAAVNPNGAVLRALLAHPNHGKEAAERYIPAYIAAILRTPLTEAIRVQLPYNVALLLHVGVNPNGYSISDLQWYAKHYQRFNNKLVAGRKFHTRKDLRENIPLMDEELEERNDTICYFWAGPQCMQLDLLDNGDGMTPIEMACKGASLEILEMVWAASPEVSFWMTSHNDIPSPATLSSLSVSSPLHCAVFNRRNDIVKRLLELGFDPNVMPLAARQQALTPLMIAVGCCEPPNWEAFEMLLANARLQRDLVTPLYKVHTVHMATAQLSAETLGRVIDAGFDLSTVENTAVGHNLLHIACLPSHIDLINLFSEEIYTSCKEVGKQGAEARYIIFESGEPTPAPTDYFADQIQLCKLLQANIPDLSALLCQIDFHGNTPLHYLACYRTPNHELITYLQSQSTSGLETWSRCQNKAGYTPKQLHEHGMTATPELRKPFWIHPHTAELSDDGQTQLVVEIELVASETEDLGWAEEDESDQGQDEF